MRASILVSAVLILVTTAVGAQQPVVDLGEFDLRAQNRASFGAPPPPPEALVQLVLDDGTAEGVFGLSANSARPFLWFNRFDGPGVSFFLQEIQVLFPQGTDADPGDAIELVVFVDDDDDPTNGATLIASIPETVQVADGDTWSVYSLATPAVIDAAATNVLVGVVGRFAANGVAHDPAAFDNTDSGRAWFALWTGDAPSPVSLPSDATMGTLASVGGGTWTIRAFGQPTPVALTEIPTLDTVGLGLLVLLLMIAGVFVARQRG